MTAISLNTFVNVSVQAGSTGRVVAKQKGRGKIIKILAPRGISRVIVEPTQQEINMTTSIKQVSVIAAYVVLASAIVGVIGHEYVKFHPAKPELKAPVEKFSCKRVSSDHPNYLTQRALCTIEMEQAANVG